MSSSNLLSSRSQDRVAIARTQAEAEYKKEEASAKAWINNVFDYYDSNGSEQRRRLCTDQIKQAAREFLRAVLMANLKELMNTDGAIDRIRETSDRVFAELREEVYDTKWPEKGPGWDRASEMRPYEEDMVAYIKNCEDWQEYQAKLVGRSEGSHHDDKSVRRPGRPANIENHHKVAHLVKALGPDWESPDNLMKLAEGMDALDMAIDPKWRREGVSTWLDKLETDQRNFIKLIRYRIQRATNNSSSK